MTQQKKHIGYDEQKSNRPVAARGGGGSGGMFRPGGLQGPRGGGGRPRGGPVGTHDARREGDAGHAVDLWKEHERQQRRKRDEGRESDDRFAALPQHQSGVLQPDSAQGRRGVAARDSDPVRFRRDPRLPYDFPDSAGTGLLVERGAGRGSRAASRRANRGFRACTGPSRRWSMWHATPAGAACPKVTAKTPI